MISDSQIQVSKDDSESQSLINENYSIMDMERFEKIFQENQDKIICHVISMQYLQVISIFSGIIFFLLLAIFLSLQSPISNSWIYISIPFLVGEITLALSLTLFLNLSVIYNDGRLILASWISYFAVNLSALALIIFSISVPLKIEGYIIVPWGLITIPLYIFIGICLLYFIFMMPALLDKKCYWDIVIISSLILNFFIFMLLLNSRLDNSYSLSYVNIFIPVWITSAFFFAYIINMFVQSSNIYDFYTAITNLISNILLTAATVLIALNLDKTYPTPYWATFLLIIFSYMIFFTERLLFQFNISFLEKN